MGNVQEILTHLDGLKRPEIMGYYSPGGEKGYHYFHDEDGKATFVIYLINHYDEIRQAVHVGQRYKAAGEDAMSALDGFANGVCFCENPKVCVHAVSRQIVFTYRTAIDDSSK